MCWLSTALDPERSRAHHASVLPQGPRTQAGFRFAANIDPVQVGLYAAEAAASAVPPLSVVYNASVQRLATSTALACAGYLVLCQEGASACEARGIAGPTDVELPLPPAFGLPLSVACANGTVVLANGTAFAVWALGSAERSATRRLPRTTPEAQPFPDDSGGTGLGRCGFNPTEVEHALTASCLSGGGVLQVYAARLCAGHLCFERKLVSNLTALGIPVDAEAGWDALLTSPRPGNGGMEAAVGLALLNRSVALGYIDSLGNASYKALLAGACEGPCGGL